MRDTEDQAAVVRRLSAEIERLQAEIEKVWAIASALTAEVEQLRRWLSTRGGLK